MYTKSVYNMIELTKCGNESGKLPLKQQIGKNIPCQTATDAV
jgi:hypothetical protein